MQSIPAHRLHDRAVLPEEPPLESALWWSTFKHYGNKRLTNDIIAEVMRCDPTHHGHAVGAVDLPPVYLGPSGSDDGGEDRVRYYAIFVHNQSNRTTELAEKHHPPVPPALLQRGYNNLFLVSDGRGAVRIIPQKPQAAL